MSSDIYAESSEIQGMILVTAVTAIIGTIIVNKLFFGGKSGRKRSKKGATGKGPTGKGKFKVYHTKILRSARVTWLIEEMGVGDDFKIIPFNPFSATTDEMDWYKSEVNPHGLVPAMVLPDGTIMKESSAICMYIAELYGQFLPDDEHEADYYNWCVHGVGTIGEHLNNVYHPTLKKIPEYRQDRQGIQRSKAKITEWLRVLDSHLEGKQFICADKMTAVDCVVGYTVMYASVVANSSILTADEFPNVTAYLDMMKRRPAFVNNVGTIKDFP